MSAEGINPDQYDQQLEHIVDTRNVSYAAAREILGIDATDTDDFTAVGEADSTGIPKRSVETSEREAAREAAHNANIELYHLQTDEQRNWKPSEEEQAAINVSIRKARAAAELSRIAPGRKQ